MCRWIAYSGPTVPLSHYVTEPSHSLISQSLNALEATTSTNGDGFGLGWYGEHQEPGSITKCVRPGATAIFAISAGISARTCFSRMCAPPRRQPSFA